MQATLAAPAAPEGLCACRGVEWGRQRGGIGLEYDASEAGPFIGLKPLLRDRAEPMNPSPLMLARPARRVATLIVVVLLSGCDKLGIGTTPEAKPSAGTAAAAPKPMALPVRAVTAATTVVEDELSAVGTLNAAESVMVRPEIAGRVTELPFKEGQVVPKGGKVVLIDASELQAAAAASRADASTERLKYSHARELLDKNFISQEAVDVARGAMEKAQARVQEDEARLAKTVIRAPFPGILGLRQISPGAYVKAGDDVVRLENVSSLKLDFRVPEMYASRIHAGQTVSVRTDAFPGVKFAGQVYATEPGLDEKTRTVVARAEVANVDGRLRPGMFARVGLLLETRPKAVVVPEQAIWPQGRDSFVYRVVDGKAALTKVVIGVRSPGQVEIAGGVQPGEWVVTDGQMKIKDGAPVTVLPAAPAPAASAPAKGG